MELYLLFTELEFLNIRRFCYVKKEKENNNNKKKYTPDLLKDPQLIY